MNVLLIGLTVYIALLTLPRMALYVHTSHGVYRSSKAENQLESYKILLRYNDRNYLAWRWITHLLKVFFLNGLAHQTFSKATKAAEMSLMIKNEIKLLENPFSHIDDLGDVAANEKR